MTDTTTLIPATSVSPQSAIQPSALSPQPSRRVSLGGIKSKPAAGAKSDYPVLPDPTGQFAACADRIRQRTDQVDALEAALEVDKKDLTFHARPFFFQHCRGKVADLPSSVAVRGATGEVLVTFTSRYKSSPDDSAVRPILGDEATDLHFRQSFELKIDGDQIPIDKAQELVDQLVALFTRFGCESALSQKEIVKPVDTFHTQRHSLFPVETNLALDDALPMTAMVKTKGRK